MDFINGQWVRFDGAKEAILPTGDIVDAPDLSACHHARGKLVGVYYDACVGPKMADGQLCVTPTVYPVDPIRGMPAIMDHGGKAYTVRLVANGIDFEPCIRSDIPADRLQHFTEARIAEFIERG